MTKHQLALLIGGVVPALLLGLSSICQKLGAAAGLGAGPMLIAIGLTSTVVGCVFCADGDLSWSRGGVAYSCLFGLCWATATGCIGLALKKYDAQISQLVPLYNMNTLVAVVIGLVALSEWQHLHPGRLLLGASLTIAGGVLAAPSAR